MKNADAKRERIIESAKRRFSHFGMAKTTMAEIAKDLSFSKALLYYYFPDKNSLYATVLDHIITERLESGDRIIDREQSVETALMAILEERMQYVKDHYNIFSYVYSFQHEMPTDLQTLLPGLLEREQKQFVKLLQKGVDRKEIEVDDIQETAKILLVALMGTRMGQVKEYRSMYVPPTKEEFDKILLMQKKLGHIFINGLKQ